MEPKQKKKTTDFTDNTDDGNRFVSVSSVQSVAISSVIELDSGLRFNEPVIEGTCISSRMVSSSS